MAARRGSYRSVVGRLNGQCRPLGIYAKGGSKSSSSQTTQVTTNTTTNIGDIGLTGAAGVELAAIAEAGAIDQEKLRVQSFGRLVDFAESLQARNAANAKTLAQVAAGQQPDLIKLAPFILAALLLSVPLLRRGR